MVPPNAAAHAALLVWFTESKPRVVSELRAVESTSTSRQSLVGCVSALRAQKNQFVGLGESD